MTNYVLNDAKMFADITDGIAIVINSDTGIYYGMNGFGTAVFQALIQGASEEDLLAAVKGLAGAPADIEARFNAFMNEIKSKELVVEGSGSGAAVIDAAIAAADKFDLSIKEYNDAQEMLLADPFHEVKETTGWTPEKDSIGYTKEETAEREKKVEQ